LSGVRLLRLRSQSSRPRLEWEPLSPHPRQGAESCGSTPCHGTGGGSSITKKEDRGRMRALAWPARPIRPYAKDLRSTALSAKREQIPAGGGGLGPSPQIIDQPIEGAVDTRQDDMRQGSAQETRGLGRATAASTVRWATKGEGRARRTDPTRRATTSVSRHSGDRKFPLGWGRDLAQELIS